MGCSPSQEVARQPRQLPGAGRQAVGLTPRHTPAGSPIQEVEPPTYKGCVMVRVAGTPSAERHYKCDKCGGKSKQGHLGGCKTKRWRCFEHDYDLCFECYPDRPSSAPQEPPLPPPPLLEQQAPLNRVTTAALNKARPELHRSTTVEVKRTLDRQLDEMGQSSTTMHMRSLREQGPAGSTSPGEFTPITPSGQPLTQPGGVRSRPDISPRDALDVSTRATTAEATTRATSAEVPTKREAPPTGTLEGHEDDFLKRCHVALASQDAVKATQVGTLSPTQVTLVQGQATLPLKTQPDDGQASPTLLQQRRATETAALATQPRKLPPPPGALAPAGDFVQGFESQLMRRTTGDVKRILNHQLDAFHYDTNLDPKEAPTAESEARALRQLAEEREADTAGDSAAVAVPELSRAPRSDAGGLWCSCRP